MAVEAASLERGGGGRWEGKGEEGTTNHYLLRKLEEQNRYRYAGHAASIDMILTKMPNFHTWKKHVHSTLAKRYKRKSRKKPKKPPKIPHKTQPHTSHTKHTYMLT